MASVALACGGKNKQAANADNVQRPNENIAAQSEQAYMDFLNGNAKITTCELFRADDAQGNYD